MFIIDAMTRTVVTTLETESIDQAAATMAHHHIHQLPVIRGQDRLVGIVTDRDVRSVHSEADQAGPVSRIMTPNPVSVSPREPLEEALLLLHRHRFGSLPVAAPPPADDVGDEALPRLVGIITRTDILAALIDMLGIEKPGTRLEIELPEVCNSGICEAIHAVAKGGARIISMVLRCQRADRRPRLYIRLSTIDPRLAVEALAEAGYRLTDPYSAQR